MPNQSWIKIQRENGKQDYAPVSRSKHYPEQGAKQLAKKLAGNVGDRGSELQPEVHSTSPGHSTNQLHTTSDNAEDSSSECNRMDR